MNEASAGLSKLSTELISCGEWMVSPQSVTASFKAISLHGHLLCSYRVITSKPGIASSVPQDLNLCYIFEDL